MGPPLDEASAGASNEEEAAEASELRSPRWYLSKVGSELACLAPTCNQALGIAKLKMADGGLAEKMLDQFRTGGTAPVLVDLDRELARNPRLREFLTGQIELDLARHAPTAEAVEGMSGAIWVGQWDYGLDEAGEDQRLSLGGTYFEYRVDGTAEDGGLVVALQVSDHYVWSPGQGRATDCLHACGAAMRRSGESTEFHQFGEGNLAVGDPFSVPLMQTLPPEMEELE